MQSASERVGSKGATGAVQDFWFVRRRTFVNNRAMAEFYDTHAHLDYPEFADELAAVIQRAKDFQITRIISIGTDIESSRQAIALSEKFSEVYAVVGWHPGEVLSAPEDIRPQLRELVQHPKVVAIGETGLDHHRLPSGNGGSAADDLRYKSRQLDLFRQHLEVAAESNLNCVIHQRDCFIDTITALEPFANSVRGVFHCFAGNADEMRHVIAMGSLVSFTGICTFKNAQSVRDTIAAAPLDQLMLETDCPFLAPVPYRGKRCEPAFVNEIAQMVATVKGCTTEELSEATCATAKQFFKKLS